MVLAVVALAILGVGYYASGIAVGPQERWQKPMAPASVFGVSPRQVRFRTADGLTLVAWWEKTWVANRGKGTLILAHGPESNKTSMAPLAGLFQRSGYHVLLPDLRAHGESAGRYSTFGYKEQEDLLAAIAWARQNTAGEPIALLGYSSGAVSALYAAARSPEVAAVIADSAFLDIDTVLARESAFLGMPRQRVRAPWDTRLRLWLFTRPGLGRVARWAFHLRTGVPFDPPEGGVKAVVAKITRPAVLYLAADHDPVVPAREIEELAAATGSLNKQVLFQPGEFHSAFAGNPQRYVETVTAFLNRWVAGAR